MREAKVWMVRLGPESDLRDVRGTIAMTDDAIVFNERDQRRQHRIALETVRSAKRVRGSPILMLSHDDDGVRRRTAFYFTPPPPLEPPETASPAATPTLIGVMPGGGPTGRRTRKRTMRANVRYLSEANIGLKDEIESWVRAIRDATAGIR